MWIDTVIILVLAIISGCCYRLGGAAKIGDSLDILRNTKTRDLGVPLLTLFAIALLHNPVWWIHGLSFLLLFGALTTYWDFVFGYDNYYAHGFVCALAYIPYAFTGLWWPFLIRVVVLTVIVGLLSRVMEKDTFEEFGRGFFITSSILIFI